MKTSSQYHHVLLDKVKLVFKIYIPVSAITLSAIKFGFHTFICCYILIHHFFWLNRGKNPQPYIIELHSVKHQACDDKPEGGTLF